MRTTIYNRYVHHAGITISDETMVLAITHDSPPWPASSLASGNYSRVGTPTPTLSSSGLAPIFQLPLPTTKPPDPKRWRAKTISSEGCTPEATVNVPAAYLEQLMGLITSFGKRLEGVIDTFGS